MRAPPRSHGTGRFTLSELAHIGEGVVIEAGVLIFHPETVSLGSRVYVGHRAILKGYHKNQMVIGDGTWIGQSAFFHSAGGIVIGEEVGIGPGVSLLTSVHEDPGRALPIMHGPLRFAAIHIGDGADLGVGAIVLPGVRIGVGAQIGAGAVVTRDVPDYAVVAGNPAKILRLRDPR